MNKNIEKSDQAKMAMKRHFHYAFDRFVASHSQKEEDKQDLAIPAEAGGEEVTLEIFVPKGDRKEFADVLSKFVFPDKVVASFSIGFKELKDQEFVLKGNCYNSGDLKIDKQIMHKAIKWHCSQW